MGWALGNSVLPDEEKTSSTQILSPSPHLLSLLSLLPSSLPHTPYPSQDSHCNGKASVPLFPIHPTLYFEIKFSKAQRRPHHNRLKILQCAQRRTSVLPSLPQKPPQSGPCSPLASLPMTVSQEIPVILCIFFTCNNLLGNGLKGPDTWRGGQKT